jgi:menaquinone-specific isochorismate synthase
MAEAGTARSPETIRGRLVSVSRRIEPVAPKALLSQGRGAVRGFWAREGRWFAHLGMAASLSVPSIRGHAHRFRSIREQARKLLDGSLDSAREGSEPTPPPRFFGGFSFAEDHEARDVWSHFPSAFFILPETELVVEDGTGILTCRGFPPPDEDPQEFREGLRDRLQDVENLLTREPPREEGRDPWIPATRAQTDGEAWQGVVERVLEEVGEGSVEKVVLARVQRVSTQGVLDPVEILMNLRRENPSSHVFLFEPRPGSVLLGAAPETVATVSEGTFRATAVAGSAPAGSSPEERRALGRRLLESRKDRREHEVCVRDMARRLAPLAHEVQAPEEPRVRVFSTIQHLETEIQAPLREGEGVLSALEALHPTPAVCGYPRDQALAFLEAEEPFQRGWYAGPVGWFDGAGNGVFAPALRSAVGSGREWRLFAGAGIVRGSDPAREWEETRMKFQPVLRALSQARPQKDPDREPEDREP